MKSIKAWRGVAWPSKPNLAAVVKHFLKENQENKLKQLLGNYQLNFDKTASYEEKISWL